MARLIADKFKEWEAECEARFNQLKANEEEETRSVASGIDLDADGEIEVNESEEKKRVNYIKR